MSVLYKALQKAEKENEARQPASDAGIDPHKVAASGALRFAGSRGSNANRLAMAVILVVAVLGGAVFLLFKDSILPGQPQQVAALPTIEQGQPVTPQPTQAVTPETGAAAPAKTDAASAPETAPSAVTADAPPAAPASAGEPAAASASPAVAAPVAAAPPAPEPTESPAAAPPPSAETQVAAAPVATKPAAPAARPAAPPARPEPMPNIPVDSPARMLSPPITVARSEFALAGVGDQVQVRQVSQSARSNVAAGYDALVASSYAAALQFYEKALEEEPSSMLALLGRGAALQKLGRGAEAQISYDQVLKIDPQNREALTNITAIVGENAPQEALKRLLELERNNPTFSPIKAQLGLIYAKIGMMPQALDYLRRASAISPESVMYQYNLALVLDHMGRRDQALASYETVLASISGGRGPVELSENDIENRVRFLRIR